MCFSAEASFVTGAIVSGIGIATIRKSKTKRQLFFSSIPLLFGVQQIAEGFLWLSMLNSDFVSLKQPITLIYLSFAHILWPTWVPFSIMLLENEKRQRNILFFFLLIGMVVSITLTYRLLTENTTSEIIGHHISYNLGVSNSTILLLSPLYFLATVLPPFFTNIKRMWLLGFLILISYVVTKIFFENFVISVWCFFSAVISIVIYSIVLNFRSSSQKITIPVNTEVK